MTVAHPAAGSFGVFADIYLGPLGGYVIRWAYVAGIALAVGTEVTAVAIYMGYWWPAVPGLWWIAGFSAALVAINAANVKLFGSVEYLLSAVKIAAILAFIALGAWLLFGPAPLPGASFANYTRHGGFFPNGAWGAWVAVIIAIFSYFSIEMIAVAAGEAAEPERAIVQAFRATIARLAIFYFATIALMLAIVPWMRAGEGGSPFVIVMGASGIAGAAGLVNFVILVAALSAMNSQLYVASRMLFSLAQAGYAPRGLARLSREGVPLRALAVAAVGIAFAAAAYAWRPETAFTFMIAVSICAAMVTWILIFATHVAFRRRRGPASGFRMPGAPWTSVAGGLLMAAILITTAFTEAFRMTLVFGVPFFALLLLVYRLRFRARAARLT
jgi:L-asparagine transporter-like permease